MTGADVAQLRDLARQLELGARTVVALGEGVRAALAAAPWVGQRADDYRRRFTTTDLTALRSAAALLDQAATNLRRNADEQEQASSASGGTGTGTGTRAGFGGGGGGSWGGPGAPLAPTPLAWVLQLLSLPPEWTVGRPGPPGVVFDVLDRLDDAAVTARTVLTELARDPRLLEQVLHWRDEVSDLSESVHLRPELVLGDHHAGAGVHAEGSHRGSTADGLFQYDASARAEASVDAGASTKISSDGLTAAAGIAAVAGVTSTAGGRVGTDAVNTHARVTAEAKAYADAGGTARVGKGGADLSATAGAGVMATVTAGLGTKVGPLRVDAQVDGHAGAGARADAGVSITPHRIGFKAKAGASVGVGAGGAVDVSVDPTELAADVAQGAARFWKGI